MTLLGTDFEKCAKWQGSVEEPAAKDLVARKVCTIKWNEVKGTIWNAIKCEEHLRSHPEAVVRQATINLYLQVWKSLGDSFPKLYCMLMSREKMSVRKFCVRRKGMICNPLMHVCMRNLWRKAEQGKKPVLILVPGSHERLASRKRIMCARNMGAHVQRGIWSTKGIKTGRDIGFPHSQERREETSK
jgi:hypothetical protein